MTDAITITPAIIGVVFESLAHDGWRFSLAAGDAPEIRQSAASLAGDFLKELEKRGLTDSIVDSAQADF